MFSLNKILLGAAALFAVASAAPYTSSAQDVAVRGYPVPSAPALVGVNNVATNVEAVDLKKRCLLGGCPTEGPKDHSTVSAILLDLNADIGPVVADIKAAIAASAGVSANINIQVILALLVKIKVLLTAALADIKVCISAHGVLSLTGSILSAIELCGLLGGLINIVLYVLLSIISACGGVHVELQVCISAIISLCADILSVCIVAVPTVKVLLATLLGAVCGLLGGLKVDISVLSVCLGL
ncbi:hypothetical protein D9611_014773 [Ephemerocybe angulata]|uniref:Transmembrane protein n=1 Tax=Ephemerocybe angulata TaxID=980116 RepID=A0A8H5C9T0_9AGAR|nr:hypothetical protein D9611_014773 [Tulosesus angulatus]